MKSCKPDPGIPGEGDPSFTLKRHMATGGTRLLLSCKKAEF